MEKLKTMPEAEFLNLGTPFMAYVKPVTDEDNKPGYALYGANGQLLAVQDEREAVILLAQENNLAPLTLH